MIEPSCLLVPFLNRRSQGLILFTLAFSFTLAASGAMRTWYNFFAVISAIGEGFGQERFVIQPSRHFAPG